MAKDFNINPDPVYSQIDEATQEINEAQKARDEAIIKVAQAIDNAEKTAETAEKEEPKKRKGRAPKQEPTCRVNVIVSPENEKYLRAMSRVQGRTITEFLNLVIDKSRERNNELYQAILKIREIQ